MRIVNRENGSPLLTMDKCIKGQIKHSLCSFQAETPCDQDPKTVRATFSKDNQDPRTLVSNVFLLLIIVLNVTWPEILDTHAQMVQSTRPKNISHNT